jgi:acyl-CoA thioesterase I
VSCIQWTPEYEHCMKKLVLLASVVLVGVGVFVVIRGREAYTNFPPLTGQVWVAFGDSLTSGSGASEGNDYPSLLSKRLGIPILNFGAPGQTSDEAVAKVEQIVQLNPRVVLMCFGGNDTLQGVPHQQTFHNLSVAIDRLQQAGAFVVLLGIRSASVRDKYHSEFKKLAKAKKVLLVPNILGGVLGDARLMSDYVHPNDQGYAVIAERLEQVLNPLLPELVAK